MTPKSQKTNENVAGVEGLEPPTHGLEIRCSIRLSYTPANVYNWMISTSLIQVKWTGDRVRSTMGRRIAMRAA